ncbi:M48 family metallopeptidase [Verrucomicrobiales bacterium]|nr:M48 family metallopeptidase [Verrucomicrobiales bacterium]
MKFVQKNLGEAAEVSSGGGDRGIAKEVVALIALSIVALTVIYFAVFAVTELVVKRLSPEQEHELFSVSGSFENSGEVPDSLKAKFELCEEVLDKLKVHEDVPKIEYKLIFFDELAPNAFAIPGGQIAVTRGLLNSLDEEISIAFVLAHELGHFVQRDHLRGLGQNLGFGICLQILFGGEVDLLTQGAANSVTAKYSRGQESGADDFGVQCVLAIYGETKGAEALFEVLEEKNTLPAWAYMFSTHPDNQTRIRRILEAKAGKK